MHELGSSSAFREGEKIGDFGDQQLFISYAAGDGNDIGLYTLSAVPEPNSMVIIVLAGITALFCRRKKHRQ